MNGPLSTAAALAYQRLADMQAPIQPAGNNNNGNKGFIAARLAAFARPRGARGW